MAERRYRDFWVRPWQAGDRQIAADLIGAVLAEYGLNWEPDEADRDVIDIERCYLDSGGAFWVVERGGQLLGTSGFYPVERGDRAVELRKMYLHPQARGVGLGRFLLRELEAEIQRRGFRTIWLETASVLNEAVQLYETSGYQAATGVETARCDRLYVKHLDPNLP